MIPDMIQVTEQTAADRVTSSTPYSLVYKHNFGLRLWETVVTLKFLGEHSSRFAVKLDDDYGCSKF